MIPTRVLVVVALLAGWVLLYVYVLSGIQEQHAQHQLYDNFRQELSSGTAPVGGRIAAGDPVAVISIPAAHLYRAVVVEGTAAGVMRDGPGHLRDTPLPGQAGASVIFGRSTTFGAPFRHISQLQNGDAITVTTGQGVFDYVVSGVRLDGDPAPAALAAGSGQLTLITAAGSGWRAGWAPNTSVYVDALLNGKPQPYPAGRPTAVDQAENQLKTDNSEHVLIQLILLLQLTLIVGIGVAWAWNTWGKWQVWVAGMPVVLAVVWELSSASAQLLPNLL